MGMADIERSRAITADTLFELASASKTITATCVFLLAEAQDLDLAAPVGHYVPECVMADRRPITLRDVLCHTSGLGDYLESGAAQSDEWPDNDAVIAQLPVWSRSARPGCIHHYSNTNYVVLVRVIEAVSGMSFPDFIEQRIRVPFSLESIRTVSDADTSLLAVGYRNLGYGLPGIERSDAFRIGTLGDGGIVSSLRDILRWQKLFWDGQIVNKRSLELMSTPGHLDSGESFAYGMGLQIETGPGGTVWHGHGGSWTNATTLIGRYTPEGIAVVVLSNEVMAPVERLSQRVYAVCRAVA